MSKHEIIYSVINTIIEKHIPDELITRFFIIFSILHTAESIYDDSYSIKDIYNLLESKIGFISKEDIEIREDILPHVYQKTLNFFTTLFKDLMVIEGYDLTDDVCQQLIKSSTKIIINNLKDKISRNNLNVKENYVRNNY